MDGDRAPTFEDLRRRYAASLTQLKRMFRRPTDNADDDDGTEGQVDDEALDAELEELKGN